MEPTLSDKAGLLAVLTAVANVQRMRVVAELTGGRVHVSELARRLGLSRPRRYIRLERTRNSVLATSGATNYTAIAIGLGVPVALLAAIAIIVWSYFRLQRHRADA